jgi:transcription elongation factor GreB
LVNHIPHNQNKVYSGAFVTPENEDGDEVEYRIVGPDEFNVVDEKLSMDSP